MTKGVSIWLDVLRVVATIVVVLSHLAYPRFTGTEYAFLRDWNVGSDAVIVFFVMSGCVIAFAADRDGSAGRFAFNRVTRLLTVIVPALMLTLVFDALGTRIDASAYPNGFYQALPVGEFLLRGVTFTNEWGAFERVRLGTNGPLWSLSYEAAYYALFGVALFAKGVARVLGLVALAWLAGLNVLLLMPAWLLGVALWQWLKAERAGGYTRAMGWALSLGGPALYLAGQLGGMPETLAALTAAQLGVADARMVLAFSDEFIWNFVIGLCTVMHVAGVAILNPQKLWGTRAIRWMAGATFSIYVTHYPALHLLDALLPEMLGRDALLLGGSVAVGLLFARYFERPVKTFRAWILPVMQRFERRVLQAS
ncbi:acyltransferase family protein [Shimia sp. MIT1388]|uniref:acyltransferase family protein n=1 Tax=Shimia sp. MIT1388 TaxID=3096992 RepID=UPI00399C2DB0